MTDHIIIADQKLHMMERLVFVSARPVSAQDGAVAGGDEKYFSFSHSPVQARAGRVMSAQRRKWSLNQIISDVCDEFRYFVIATSTLR